MERTIFFFAARYPLNAPLNLTRLVGTAAGPDPK
jgi:hypothetical protein